MLIDKLKGLVSLFDPYGDRHDGVRDAVLRLVREDCSKRKLCAGIVWCAVTVPVPPHSFLRQTDGSSCGFLMFAYVRQKSVVHSCRICLRFPFGPRPRPYPHVTRRRILEKGASAVFDM